MASSKNLLPVKYIDPAVSQLVEREEKLPPKVRRFLGIYWPNSALLDSRQQWFQTEGLLASPLGVPLLGLPIIRYLYFGGFGDRKRQPSAHIFFKTESLDFFGCPSSLISIHQKSSIKKNELTSFFSTSFIISSCNGGSFSYFFISF